ncbi:hypothetical protein [Methylobacter sp.]|nr:hypothetical protein [Methylobacter sp.]
MIDTSLCSRSGEKTQNLLQQMLDDAEAEARLAARQRYEIAGQD